MEQQEGKAPEEAKMAAPEAAMCCCPVCGGVHMMPWGRMKMMKHMMAGGPGGWGMMPGGPWGWGMMRMRPWGMMGMGMGIVPALLGFVAGFMVCRGKERG